MSSIPTCELIDHTFEVVVGANGAGLRATQGRRRGGPDDRLRHKVFAARSDTVADRSASRTDSAHNDGQEILDLDQARACRLAQICGLCREPTVSRRLKDIVLDLLNAHRIMSISTNRSDGWPQTTLVSYVNDGFFLYCFVARDSQKVANILYDPRVSIAIGSDVTDPRDIKGLSLAGRANLVTDPGERDAASALRLERYPEYANLSPSADDNVAAQRMAMQPAAKKMTLLCIVPEIISMVDYSKGFGHSDLITFSERDLDFHIESRRDQWVDNGISDQAISEKRRGTDEIK